MGKPKIRFKGYTDEWEQRKLNTITDVRDGTHDSPKYVEVGHPFITSKNVKDGYINYDDVQYVSDEDFEEINKRSKVDINDILMGMIGTVGNIALVRETPNFAIKNVALIKDTEEVFYLYLYHCLQSNSIVRQLSENLDGGTQKFIALNKIRNLNIPLPNKNEQYRVGNFLEILDNLITLHQRKYEQAKTLKKYMLQKMFPQDGMRVPEIRFAGFTDEWEQRKFSDCAQRESLFQTSSYDCPSVEYEDVIAEEGCLNKDIRLKEVQKTGIKFDGTQVLYGKLRPYLHNWLNPDFMGVAVGDWWVFRPVEIDKNFLYRLIQTKKFDNVANQSSGSKMPRADWNLVSQSEFIVPISLEEQCRIAEAFEELDRLITLHQRKCDELRKIKKYMLQNMFC